MMFNSYEAKAVCEWLEESKLIFEAHTKEDWQELKDSYQGLLPHTLDIEEEDIDWEEVYEALHENDGQFYQPCYCNNCFTCLGMSWKDFM